MSVERWASTRCSIDAAESRLFVNAVRDVLGLAPLYPESEESDSPRHNKTGDSREDVDRRRFFAAPYSEQPARTPVRCSP